MSSSQVSRKRPRIEHEEVEVEEVVEVEEEGEECEEDNSNSQNDNPDNENTTIINEINDDFKSIKVKNSIESNASNISNISSTSSTSSPSSDQRLLEVQRKLEPSIFNVQPHSDFIRYLSDFLYNQLNSENIEHLEIEAKLGLLLDKNNPEKTRINLPVECETIISPNESSWIKFESNLTKDQHANFNYILNQRTEQTQNLNYHGSKINYQHLHETDRIYETDRGKIRVTTNEHGKIIEGKIVQKTTIANLNIYSPRTNCDYRISVNIEKPMEMPRGQYVFERKKNRMSYCHQLFKVDLTQVEEAKKTTYQNYNYNNYNNNSQSIKHELEIEFIDPKVLYKEKLDIIKKQQSKFRDIVEIFVNNIRLLAKKCN